MEKNSNKINQVFKTVFENIDSVSTRTSVFGEPIKNGKDIIIPVSDVTCYVLFAGGEYGKINFFSKNNDFPYSVGNGSIVSVKPNGFLIKNEEGEYKILNTSQTSLDKLTESILKILNEKTNN